METRKATESTQSRKKTCPQCENNHVETVIQEEDYVYGTGESAIRLQVEIPVHTCNRCEFQFTDWEGSEIKHNALCQHFGVLNPTQIMQLRKKHNMTRTAFAELTGIGEASLNRWEKGINIQSFAHDRFLRLLDDPVVLNKLKREVLRIESHRHQIPDNVSPFKFLRNPKKLKEEQRVFELRKAA